MVRFEDQVKNACGLLARLKAVLYPTGSFKSRMCNHNTSGTIMARHRG
jgi:hypothetical protein